MGRRIKLSYTVEEDDVLSEVAKLLGLSSDELQLSVTLFNELQTELRGEDPETTVNINKCYETINKFRQALFNVDTRLGEVTDIMRGMDELRRALEETRNAPPSEEPEAEPLVPDAE